MKPTTFTITGNLTPFIPTISKIYFVIFINKHGIKASICDKITSKIWTKHKDIGKHRKTQVYWYKNMKDDIRKILHDISC